MFIIGITIRKNNLISLLCFCISSKKFYTKKTRNISARVSLGNQTHMYRVTTCQTPLISLFQTEINFYSAKPLKNDFVIKFLMSTNYKII